MSQIVPTNLTLSIVPLGAGDLIDRAVRFYRVNFWTFILIAAPPVVAGTVVSVGWTIFSRAFFSVGPSNDPFETAAYYISIWLGTLLIWFIETVVMLCVMGGASLNFVRHLLFGERITFRETYRNTWTKIAGLIAASSILTILLGIVGIVVFYFGLAVGALLVFFAAYALGDIPPLAFVVAAALGIGAAAGTTWLFFLVASRFAYVPQVMMVEGQGVFAAIGRSAGLASGNVKRLAALFIFSTAATYSALAILYVPLAWYASAQGVELFGFGGDLVPAWYEIASQLIWQASLILLTPVWMIGLCLLYVDERVRHEGYDIELMAAKYLGEIPSLPETYVSPLHPALMKGTTSDEPSASKSPFTTLGLK